jgi:uncharacterized membrane protein
MELLDKYNEEIVEDVKIDQINILDKQLMLPAIKHKWISRLMQTKRQKVLLDRKKKELKEQVLTKITASGIPTGVPQASIKQKVESSETIRKIDEELKDLDLVIEYLEKVEKVFSSFTYDISNATKLMVLETT